MSQVIELLNMPQISYKTHREVGFNYYFNNLSKMNTQCK